MLLEHTANADHHEWSLGALLRFSAAMTRQTEGEGSDEVVLQNTTYGFTLEFSALYH